MIALKELDVRHVAGWKAHELFEREGETLRSLQHPGIPAYVDAFVVESDDDVRLFLAQEFVDGPTLEQEVIQGRRWDERQLLDDLVQLLDALAYLHALSPPVVHRDIKPANLIRRDEGPLALIDFGAVQTVLPVTVGGSTIIGTPGYMPIEQLMGRAVPATDLYAVGATCLRLLTHREPSDFDVVRNRIQFQEHVRVSPEMCAILGRMLEPSAEDRFVDAGDALEHVMALIDNRGVDAGESALAVAPQHAVVRRFPAWVSVEGEGSDRHVITATMDVDGSAVVLRSEEVSHHLELMARRRPQPSSFGCFSYGATALMMLVAVVFRAPLWMVLVIGGAFLLLDVFAKPRSPAPHMKLRLSDGTLSVETKMEQVSSPVDQVDGVFLRDNTVYISLRRAKPIALLAVADDERDRGEWLAQYLRERFEAPERAIEMSSDSSE